jgi:hypothetical protein
MLRYNLLGTLYSSMLLRQQRYGRRHRVTAEMKTSLNIVLTDKFCVESENNGAWCGKHTAVLSCNDRMTAY